MPPRPTVKPMRSIDWLSLFWSVVFCQAAGMIGSVFTYPSIASWYVFLNKPSFSPPSWLFGPAWITLYTLMGIAFYLIWQKGEQKKAVKSALVLFIFHLVVNTLWSILFFGLRSPILGLLDISLLWVLIVLIIKRFYQLDKTAAYLLIPYLAWVSFASLLNFAVWRLN